MSTLRTLARLLVRAPRSTASFSGYKSSISLDKLYPNSSLNFVKMPSVPQNRPATFSGFIPMEQIQISYCRSSGPGGMNVNKVNTKVDIRFELDKAEWIPEEIRRSMKDKYRNQITKDGCIVIMSDRTRFQHLNMADALEKLRELIRAAEPVQVAQLSPETLEKLRRKREKAARERLQIKRTRGSIKSERGASSISDA